MHIFPRPTRAKTLRSRLTLTPLEGRDNPAGTITAVLSNGLLTLTGDAANNTVTLLRTDTNITLTPDATTSIAGSVPGAAVTLPGSVTGLRATLGDGNDVLSIDTAAAFNLRGAATVNLGNGDNALNLRTTGRLDLGTLAVTGGTGTDDAVVRGGVGLGSRVTGTATFKYGAGETDTELSDVGFFGSGGVQVTASGVGNRADVFASNVTVANTLKATAGTAFLNVEVEGGSLGGLTASGTDTSAELTGASVFGGVSLIGRNGPVLNATDVAVSGAVSLSGTDTRGSAVASFAGTNRLGSLKVTGGAADVVAGTAAGNSLSVAGDVSVSGRTEASLDASFGTFTARNVSVQSAGGDATFDAVGAAVTVNGNLGVSAGFTTDVRFDTTGMSEVLGSTTVTGGTEGDRFTATSRFRSRGGLSLNLGNGNDTVVLGDAAGRLALDGNLSVNVGSGTNGVTLRRVNVGGTTSVRGTSGVDTVSVEGGSTFARAATFDLGTGNDTLSMAQDLGADGPVTFNGAATLALGTGTNTLTLGRTVAMGGDANTRVVFNGPTKITGVSA